MLMSIFTPFYTIGVLLDNLILFLYINFPSFMINVCLSIIFSVVFISIINNALFNPPEHIQDQINHENKIIQEIRQETSNKIALLKKDKLQFVKRLPEPSDQVNFHDSVKYQGDYEFNLDNPILTKPIPGQTLIYKLGQSGSMLSTVVPNNSTAVFENI
jgi:hypothetical protein